MLANKPIKLWIHKYTRAIEKYRMIHFTSQQKIDSLEFILTSKSGTTKYI